MIIKTAIHNFLKDAELITVIDVRSPSEFRKGHIPGAVNIPLFSDEERKVVGTLYVKNGREEAIRKGFEFVAAKYTELLNAGVRHSKSGQLLVYCWRGGMRSASLAWLWSINGTRVKVLEGGYKYYRRLVRSTFSKNLKLAVIGGKTGSGKTDILKELGNKGEQILDLEGIARHKGSAFGSLGELEQPSSEHFENLLLYQFLKLDSSKRIWLEDESHSIGKVFIPKELFDQMRLADIYYIEMDTSLRVKRLEKDYSLFPDNELEEGVQKISKRLGGADTKKAIRAIREKDYATAIEITLRYYDKTYAFGFGKRSEDKKHIITAGSISAVDNAGKILSYINNTGI